MDTGKLAWTCLVGLHSDMSMFPTWECDLTDSRAEYGGECDLHFDIAGIYQMFQYARAMTYIDYPLMEDRKHMITGATVFINYLL